MASYADGDNLSLSRIELREEMRQMLVETYAALNKQKSSAIAPETAQQKPLNIAASITPNQSSKLKTENIGYFDPTSPWAPALSTPATDKSHDVYTDEINETPQELFKEASRPVPTWQDLACFDSTMRVDIPKQRLLQSVEYFAERIRQSTSQYQDVDIFQLLPRCLRGPALAWFSNHGQGLDLNKCLEELVIEFEKKTPTQAISESPIKSANQIQQLHQVISERANQQLAHSLQRLDNDEYHYAMAWLRYQEQQVPYKCKRCSAAFPSKNRLHSDIRECYMKTTLSSKSAAAPHTCSVALVSASGIPSNQAAASSITPVATVATATATATNEASTSSHAAKETASASKSQIASKLAAHPLVPSETATPTSPLSAYRAISPPPPEYQAKPRNYLTIDDLYTRYAPLRCIRSSHLRVQDLYMRYAPLNSIKSSPISARPSSSISTRSTRPARPTPKVLSIMTIKDLYKQLEKSAEKIALGTPICIQHALGSQNKPTVSLPAGLSASLSVNQNAAPTSKLRSKNVRVNKDPSMIQRTEKSAYGAVKWTHRSPVNQHARIQEACDTKTSKFESSLGPNIKTTQRSTEKDINSAANQTLDPEPISWNSGPLI